LPLILPFTTLSAASTLEDELERLALDVRLVEIRVLIVLRVASTLDEELLRLRLEV
jgi:hypothetical protein